MPLLFKFTIHNAMAEVKRDAPHIVVFAVLDDVYVLSNPGPLGVALLSRGEVGPRR